MFRFSIKLCEAQGVPPEYSDRAVFFGESRRLRVLLLEGNDTNWLRPVSIPSRTDG